MTSEERTFLLEVGCEDIPAAMVPGALRDLSARLLESLRGEGDSEGLGGVADAPPSYGGPRRLVACLTGIRAKEDDRDVVVTGPPVSAAFDPQGAPTRAAQGFARAQGVAVEELRRVRGEKGEVVAARKRVTGRTAMEVLAESCPRVLSSLRFPKMMKWGDRGYQFVRPVHWILALLDGEVVPFDFLGVTSGRATRGHRFLAPGPHEVAHAGEYERILRDEGKVIVSNRARRERIRTERDRVAASMGWKAREDESLLEELTYLSEFPGVIAGTFPEDLLSLDEEFIVTPMRHHQKYFPADDAGGGLAAGFLAVMNSETDREGLIRRGNEWVLRARLADARFFRAEDKKRSLADRVPDLARVVFHEKLGDYLQRTQRLERLAGWLAGALSLTESAAAAARTAARLCKADLTTGMVGEFPELQGITGGIYVRESGLPDIDQIEAAIRGQYMTAPPEGGATDGALVVALADKLDLLVGCFAAGLIPKGSADPYGLRRAALGVCRLVADEGGLRRPLSLRAAAGVSLEGYAEQGLVPSGTGTTIDPLLSFVAHRLEFLMQEGGIRIDTARAVLAAGADDLNDAWLRARALTSLRAGAREEREADFLSLAAAAKRIRNILAQAAEKGIRIGPDGVARTLLKDAEEKDLHVAVERTRSEIERRIASSDYNAALKEIAALRPLVDRFFDKILVMAPDEELRANRLALLSGLAGLLGRVAEFSEIVVEGESSVRSA